MLTFQNISLLDTNNLQLSPWQGAGQSCIISPFLKCGKQGGARSLLQIFIPDHCTHFVLHNNRISDPFCVTRSYCWHLPINCQGVAPLFLAKAFRSTITSPRLEVCRALEAHNDQSQEILSESDQNREKRRALATTTPVSPDSCFGFFLTWIRKDARLFSNSLYKTILTCITCPFHSPSLTISARKRAGLSFVYFTSL